MNIRDGVALVTGGGSGLGAATARHLAALGARIAVLDRDALNAAAIAEEIGGFSVACDIADDAATEAAVARVLNEFGVPRVLVNCAGIGLLGLTLRKDGPVTMREVRRTFDVNFMGSFNVARLCAQRMALLAPLATGERGVIVNTSSIAGLEGTVGQVVYGASKGAVAAMTLPLSRELGRYAIRVVDIAPGFFQTPMIAGLSERSRNIADALKPSFPQRAGQPEEFALLVASIVSNPMLNGTTIRLDGGLRMPSR